MEETFLIFWGIVALVGLIWIWNSLYVIKEWGARRGAALGPHDAGSEAGGVAHCILADRNFVSHSAAIGNTGRAAAGHYYAR